MWPIFVSGDAFEILTTSIQTVLFIVSFALALDYLKEHNSKLKLEEERKIIHEILNSLYTLDSIYKELFWKLEFDEEKIQWDGNVRPIFLIANDVYLKYKKFLDSNQKKIENLLESLNKNKWILERKIYNIINPIQRWAKAIMDLQEDYENLASLLENYSETFEKTNLNNEQERILYEAVKKLPENLHDEKNEKVFRINRELFTAKNECVKKLG